MTADFTWLPALALLAACHAGSSGASRSDGGDADVPMVIVDACAACACSTAPAIPAPAPHPPPALSCGGGPLSDGAVFIEERVEEWTHRGSIDPIPYQRVLLLKEAHDEKDGIRVRLTLLDHLEVDNADFGDTRSRRRSMDLAPPDYEGDDTGTIFGTVPIVKPYVFENMPFFAAAANPHLKPGANVAGFRELLVFLLTTEEEGPATATYVGERQEAWGTSREFRIRLSLHMFQAAMGQSHHRTTEGRGRIVVRAGDGALIEIELEGTVRKDFTRAPGPPETSHFHIRIAHPCFEREADPVPDAGP